MSDVGVRFNALNAFIDETVRTLPANEALAWLALYRHARKFRVKLSHSRLAATLGVSTRTSKRLITRLIDRGLVRVVQRGSIRNGATEYAIRTHPPPI